MQLSVNGERICVSANCTITGLLEHLQISRERVAVEVNMDIISKAHYDAYELKTEDKVEIVQFVGGG